MDDKRSKDKSSRREQALVRAAADNPYLKEMIDAAADRPEEVCISVLFGYSATFLGVVDQTIWCAILKRANLYLQICSGRKAREMKAKNI
jgi:hypothetical protein